MTDTNIITLFCVIKECCNFLAPEQKQHALGTSGKPRRRNRPCLMSGSEVITLFVLSHTSCRRDLKSYGLGYVCHHMRKEFPRRLSY